MHFNKNEDHIFGIPQINEELSKELGEFVIILGRLEDAFKVAIDRIDENHGIEQAIEKFQGPKGDLGNLINKFKEIYTTNNHNEFEALANEGMALNGKRQDYVHATITSDPQDGGSYVRFRKGQGNYNLDNDIQDIKDNKEKAIALIKNLGEKTKTSHG